MKNTIIRIIASSLAIFTGCLVTVLLNDAAKDKDVKGFVKWTLAELIISVFFALSTNI